MEYVIIGASVIAFLLYLFFYRYFGIDARIEMLILHSIVLLVIAGLVVLLWISVTEDYGAFAVTSAIASLTGFGLILLKFLFAEFGASKRI
jgi:hypothetical protein